MLPSWLQAAVGRFSGVTFGMYLMHFYFVERLPAWLGIDGSSILWRLGGAAVIFALCAVLTRLLQKIPVLRFVVG